MGLQKKSAAEVTTPARQKGRGRAIQCEALGTENGADSLLQGPRLPERRAWTGVAQNLDCRAVCVQRFQTHVCQKEPDVRAGARGW